MRVVGRGGAQEASSLENGNPQLSDKIKKCIIESKTRNLMVRGYGKNVDSCLLQ